MDLRLNIEELLHVVSKDLRSGALLLAAEQQHVVRRSAPIPSRDHVQERDEVLTHPWGELFGKAKVKQHQLQLRPDLFQGLMLSMHLVSLQSRRSRVLNTADVLRPCTLLHGF